MGGRVRTLAAAALALFLSGGSAAAEAAEPPVAMAASHIVAPGENLEDIARANDLGFVEVMAANPGVDPWLPAPGTRLILPTVHLPPQPLRPGLTANLGDMRLYWLRAPGAEPLSFPMGIGREGWSLRSVTTRVVGKRVHPTWTPPHSIRAEKPWLPAVVPPGPDNPLGDYSLDLGLGLIRIHGTNLPDGVGRRTSHGCLRLYPEDIAHLFPQVGAGTRVTIIDQPAKLAWIGGALWLQINPDQGQADAVEDRKPMPIRPVAGLREQVIAAAGPAADRVDWAEVEWAERHRPAIPIRITPPAK